jgi:uncharacterized protein
MDAIPFFFLLGFVARLARSDLKIPGQLYEALSIYLLLAIGLKGGMELARQDALHVLPQALAVMALGALIPLIAFPVLYKLGRFDRFNAAAIAGHYGSVSVVTFAVAIDYLRARDVDFEAYMPLFLVLLEMPGIAVGILLARLGTKTGAVRWGALGHEIFLGKSMVLLGGGLLIGWVAGPQGLAPLEPFFFDLFKGVLCLFLLEMGLVAASQAPALRSSGVFVAGRNTVARHTGCQRLLYRGACGNAYRGAGGQPRIVDHRSTGCNVSFQYTDRHTALRHHRAFCLWGLTCTTLTSANSSSSSRKPRLKNRSPAT